MWQAECYYCLRNNLDLQSTILYLKRIERPIPLLQTEPSIAASATHKHRDGRSKDKRKEKEREPRPRSKRPRSPSSSSSRSRSTSLFSSSRHTRSSVQCYFCEKREHVQSECKEYKKAKSRLREKEKGEDDKDKDKDKGKLKGSAYYTRLLNQYDEGSLS